MKKLRLTEADKNSIRNEIESLINKPIPKDFQLKLTTPAQLETNIIKPTIKISTTAYCKINMLVNKAEGEIGFHATLYRLPEPNNFYLHDILIYPQKVSPTYIDVDEKEYSEWQDKISDEEFPYVRCQIHSHVNMNTSPSGTDDEHYEKIIKLLHKDDDYYLFLIVNKKNDLYAQFYDFKQNTIFDTKEIKFEVVESTTNEIISTWVEESMKDNLTPLQRTCTVKEPYPKGYYPTYINHYPENAYTYDEDDLNQYSDYYDRIYNKHYGKQSKKTAKGK